MVLRSMSNVEVNALVSEMSLVTVLLFHRKGAIRFKQHFNFLQSMLLNCRYVLLFERKINILYLFSVFVHHTQRGESTAVILV